MSQASLPSLVQLPRPPTSLAGVVPWAGNVVRVLGLSLRDIIYAVNQSAPQTGTWSPGISADGTAGTATYDHRYGRYTLQGQEVSVWGDVEITNWTGSPAGNFRVHGLPFIHENGNPETVCVVSAHSGINLSTGYTQVVGVIQTNSQNVRFYEVGDNVTAQLVQASQVATAARVKLFARYRKRHDAVAVDQG